MALQRNKQTHRGSCSAAGRITSGPLFLFLGLLLFLLLIGQIAIAEDTADTDPPQLTVERPWDWIATYTEILVYYSDAGSGVDTDTISVVLDGDDITDTCVIYTDRVWCSTGPYETVEHSVTVSISDNAGNTGSITKEFRRDFTRPQITSTSPSNRWANTSDPVVGVTATDPESGINASELYLAPDNGAPLEGCTITEYPPYSANISCPLSGLADGVYDFDFHAEAGNGVSVSWDLDSLLKVDTQAPVISNVSPVGWITLSGIGAEADITDAAPGSIASATITIDDGPELDVCSVYGGHIDCDWVLGLADGQHDLTVTGYDAAGNTGVSNTMFAVDTTKPSISNITPSGVIGSGPVTVEADLSDLGSGIDPDSVEVKMDYIPLTDCLVENGHVSCAAGEPSVGTHIIYVKVSDNASWFIAVTSSFEVVSNQPPVLSAGADVSAAEGSVAAKDDIAASDPNGDALTVSASAGSITGNGDGTWSWSLPVVDDATDSQTVTITADDGNGGIVTSNFDLSVENVSPDLGAIDAPVVPNMLGDTVDTSVSFSDAGTLDTHTATWQWGDGTSSAGTINEAGGSGAAGGSHEYEAAGVYTVTVIILDKDGGEAQTSYMYIVIYDPSSGFVTGGGWIDSPEGAYLPDPDLTGKANFGFVSKYKKGASVPTGQTEFNFKAGDLDFHSTSYEWMVIAGHKAMYKGNGTINGAGGYRFMLTAIDGDHNGGPDKLRIKIWNESTSDVVYDNQRGATDDDDPVTAIGGGNIVIHEN